MCMFPQGIRQFTTDLCFVFIPRSVGWICEWPGLWHHALHPALYFGWPFLSNNCLQPYLYGSGVWWQQLCKCCYRPVDHAMNNKGVPYRMYFTNSLAPICGNTSCCGNSSPPHTTILLQNTLYQGAWRYRYTACTAWAPIPVFQTRPDQAIQT